MTILSIIGIIIEIITIAGEVSDKEDVKTRPLNPPTSFLPDAEFEILQYIVMWITLFFFRNIVNSRNKSFDSSYDENAQANKKRKTLKVKQKETGSHQESEASREAQ